MSAASIKRYPMAVPGDGMHEAAQEQTGRSSTCAAIELLIAEGRALPLLAPDQSPEAERHRGQRVASWLSAAR